MDLLGQNHTIRWQKMSIELLKERLMNVSGWFCIKISARPSGQRRAELCFHISYLELVGPACCYITPPRLRRPANRTGLHIWLWAMKYYCVDSHNWSQAPPIKPQYLRLTLVQPYLIMVEGNFLNSAKMILCPSWLVERFPHKCCQYSHFSPLKKPRISKSDNLGIFTTVSNFAV